MYDIHCHILCGIDDGADTLREAVEMAKIAYEGGTKTIVATPHCNIPDMYRNLWDDDLKKRFEETQNAIQKAGVPVKLLPGQEVFCYGYYMNLLRSGELITLNNSRYPLVEFEFDEHSENVLAKLQVIKAEGLVPVLAHPERYDFIAEDFNALLKIKKMGCIVQLNKGSLKGNFGRTVQAVARSMLDAQLVDVIASDGHGPYVRTPYLSDVHEMISEMYSTDYAEMLLTENPKAILEDKNILTY